ncbi:MAG: EamA family transporter, partial [Pelagibacteraceae bacterium]
ICTGLAYYLYYELLNQIGIVKSTLIVYLIPVFSILLGVLFLKESVSLNETLGISIVLFSSYLIMDEKNLGKK